MQMQYESYYLSTGNKVTISSHSRFHILPVNILIIALHAFETITLIMELVNWSRKEPTNEVRFCSILYFIHKIVRKIGQNRDFVKFHQALRN